MTRRLRPLLRPVLRPTVTTLASLFLTFGLILVSPVAASGRTPVRRSRSAAGTPAVTSEAGTCPTLTTFAAGPLPSAAAPAAVAVDPGLHRLYVVQNQDVTETQLPTNEVSVADESTGALLTAIPVGNDPEDVAVDPVSHKVFVTNIKDNTVSVIDGTTDTVVATVPVGTSPDGVAVDSRLGQVYVANEGVDGNGSVSIISTTSNAVVGTVQLGVSAYAVAVDPNPNTDLVYLTTSNAGSWSLTVVNPTTETVQASVEDPNFLSLTDVAVDPGFRAYVSDDDGGIGVFDISNPDAPSELSGFTGGTVASAVAVDPSSHDVYVADLSADQINVFNSSGNPLAHVATQRKPDDVALDVGAGRAFVANQASDSLSVISTASETALGTDVLGTADFGIAYDPTQQRFYVANAAADAIEVVDARTHALLTHWIAGAGPWAVAVDPSLKQVYSVNTDDGTVTVFDSGTGQVKATLPVGSAAQVIAVDPSNHRVYVTGGSGLTVIDGTTNQVVATVATGSDPVGIAVDDAIGEVFVVNHDSETISVVNTNSNTVAATWQLPQNNIWGLALDPTLQRLYVTVVLNTVGGFTGVDVLDAHTGNTLGQIPFTANAANADLDAVDPATHQVYVTSQDNTLKIIDGVSDTLINSYNVGTLPNDVIVDPTTDAVYVGNSVDGTITQLAPCVLRGKVFLPFVVKNAR